MMNYKLKNIPVRTGQPRKHGLTIVSDNGLSIADAENLLSVAGGYVDMVKLGFGTGLVTNILQEKIEFYHAQNVPVFFGGLLFEAFLIRNEFEKYLDLVKKHKVSVFEISDGDIQISHEEKCNYIRRFSGMGTVISEIGSKDKDRVQVTPPYKWIELIQAELDAGSAYIIAEAKESGDVGLYRDSGEVREGLVHEILTKVPAEKLIWEAPRKDQQLFFIKTIGCNANLANIRPQEVIPLETMRLGLRSDSFHFYLDGNGEERR